MTNFMKIESFTFIILFFYNGRTNSLKRNACFFSHYNTSDFNGEGGRYVLLGTIFVEGLL